MEQEKAEVDKDCDLPWISSLVDELGFEPQMNVP